MDFIHEKYGDNFTDESEVDNDIDVNDELNYEKRTFKAL